MRQALLLVLAVAGCISCGGTWEDDPKNWRRIFGEKQPLDVEIVHSRYWLSPHWTHEFSFHLHLKANERYEKELKERYNMVRGTRPGPRRWADGPEVVWNGEDNDWGRCSGTTDWFTPKPVENYDVWVEPGDPTWHHLTLYVDRDTHELFLCDVQL